MHDLPPSRRKHTRYHCTGGVELRRNESAPAIFGNLSDISLEGCYVESVSTLPVGSELLFMLRVKDNLIRGRATVQASNHAVGMGLEFMHLATEDQQKLEFVLGSLAGTQEMRPVEKRRPVQEEPIRVPAPLSRPTRPVPTASITTPLRPMTAAAAPQITSVLSQKIMRSVNELNELEQNLVKERVDP
ncbi:MAG: PilZ domain-containing protein, partial [Candidatus Angelobacter sp.]